jgi:hypothetical protein
MEMSELCRGAAELATLAIQAVECREAERDTNHEAADKPRTGVEKAPRP